MKLIARLVPSALALIALSACGDDTPAPGTLIVHWSHGATATCGTRNVDSLEARLIKSGEVVAHAGTPCPADAAKGDITLLDVPKGTYLLEVEAFQADEKGTYFASVAKQSVASKKDTDTAELILQQKPALLVVDWTVPGGKCAASAIKTVEITVYNNAGTTSDIKTPAQKVACDGTYKDPETGAATAGALFLNIEPDEDVSVIAYGLNSDKKRIAKAQTEIFPVTAGDELKKVLALEICPGDTPTCD